MKSMFKTIPLLLFVFFIAGCAGYKFQEVEVKLGSGHPEDAYTYLQDHAPRKPDIPFLFELGVAAHYANRFSESNAAFEEAAEIAEDRYTKSLSREVGSLVSSDTLRPYSATQYERLLSHYYRVLNYIYLDQLDGALVECRRATNLINYFKGEDENYDFFASGFLAYLSGMLFEAAGEWNDAYISYKQAAEYYENAAQKTGLKVPDDIGYALVGLTWKLGFTDEFERYKRHYGEPSQSPPGTGELVIFYESGYIPEKHEQSLTFPILKVDDVDDEKFVSELMKREGALYKDTELEYLLRVAIPAVDSRRPSFAGIEVSIGDMYESGVLVMDVENIALEVFKTERPLILLRTLVRAVGKYLLYREADEKHKALGLLANLAGVLTEQADTRSWRTLPNRIFVVRMPVPAGRHQLQYVFLGANGDPHRSISGPDVEIYPNGITFLNHRTFD